MKTLLLQPTTPCLSCAATIDDLEEGGFNFIGNFELKDALSYQFPGLDNASSGTSNEISLAINELQQAVNQLENGGINSISNADIQSALRNQFPDIENSGCSQRRHV